MTKYALALLLLLPAAALAQTSDDITFRRTFLLRNVAGTAANPGDTPHHPHLIDRGAWTYFLEGSAHVSYSSETGPEEQRNEVFSTNWLGAGAQRTLGTRGLALVRGRVSLEPYTLPEEGYPQMLQFVSPGSGGPLLDSMRAHDLVEELAAHLAYRVGSSSFAHVYLAPVGNPPLGPVPFAQRASSEEFAEAPYAYDVQESFHHATSVATAGFATKWIGVEYGVFHHAITTGRHDEIEADGDIDSWAGRVTLTLTKNLSAQFSTGELTDFDREVTSASISYGTDTVATSVIYTKREELSSLGFDTTFRLARNSFMVRIETVERPPGFLGNPAIEQTTHFTVGYLFDFLASRGYRAGAGVNVDYHTQTHELDDRYGHKPQTIYVFARVRTDSKRR